MKGLRKYLTPFAPDQSGAVSVLYQLGGILVICDAGGCTGNICGFDEPRWQGSKSAVFSAGLRDMDAILGRDDRLVAKLADTAKKLDAAFAAVIGTPVPAVIATDYQALRRMAEKKIDLPVLTVDTNGMELYDAGAEKAFLTLFRRFAQDVPVEQGRIGVLGMSPLDLSDVHAGERLTELLQARGWKTVHCYGMGAGLSEISTAGGAEMNLVVSPAGLRTAEYLKERYGTPYTLENPLISGELCQLDPVGKRCLVIHQQVTANTVRRLLLERGAASVTAATWFLKKPELSQPGDLRLTEEDQLMELVQNGNYDMILCDSVFWEMFPEYAGELVDLRHFAVSGRLYGNET